LTIAKWKI